MNQEIMILIKPYLLASIPARNLSSGLIAKVN
jgi:hypothetical protein